MGMWEDHGIYRHVFINGRTDGIAYVASCDSDGLRVADNLLNNKRAAPVRAIHGTVMTIDSS